MRLTYALPLAFALAFVWPEAVDAGLYVPKPAAGSTATSNADLVQLSPGDSRPAARARH